MNVHSKERNGVCLLMRFEIYINKFPNEYTYNLLLILTFNQAICLFHARVSVVCNVKRKGCNKLQTLYRVG